MKTVFAPLAAAVALLAAQHAGAQTPQTIPPFTTVQDTSRRPLLSFQLEQEFKRFLDTCPSAAAQPLVLTRPKRGLPIRTETLTVSSIDRDVIRQLRLTENPTVAAAADLSLVRLFGYVYTAETLPDQWPESRFLKLAYDDRSLTLQPGFPALRLRATCSSVLLGALSAAAEYSLPVASLSGALTADFQSRSRSSLRLASGRFVSPIWEMWEGADLSNPDWAKHRLFAAVTLWNWHGGTVVGTPYLLRHFDGTVVYRELETDRTGGGTAQSSSRLAFPIVTVGTRASAEARETALLEISDMRVFVSQTSNVPALAFEPMPPISQILDAAFGAARPAVTYPEGQRVENGQRRAFQVVLTGLPTGLCEAEAWRLQDARDAASASTALRLEQAERSETGCRFTAVYTAPANGGSGADEVFRPVLATTILRGGKSLELPAGEVRFERSPGPTLAFRSLSGPRAVPEPSTPTETWQLGWTIDFRLSDAQPYSSITAIDVSDLRLDCPPGTITGGEVSFTAAFEPSQSVAVRTLRLSGRGQHRGDLDAQNLNPVGCQLAGDVFYTSQQGIRLRRAVPSDVTVPYPTPPPPPRVASVDGG